MNYQVKSKINSGVIALLFEKISDYIIIFLPFLYFFVFKSVFPSVTLKISMVSLLLVTILFTSNKLTNNKLTVLLVSLFMYVYIILSYLFLDNYSSDKIFFWVYNLTCYLFLYLNTNKGNFLKISKSITILVFVFLILAFLEIFTGKYILADILGSRSPFLNQVSNDTGFNYAILNFYNINDLVYFFVLATPFVLVTFKNTHLVRYTYLISVFALSYFNESVIGKLFVILFICLYFVFKKIGNTKINILKVIGLILGSVIITISITIGVELLSDLISQGSFNERLDIIVEGIRLSVHNLPYGIGIDGGNVIFGIPMHNLFLNVFLEQGIFMLIPLMLIYFKIFNGTLKMENKEIKYIFLTTIILFLITNMMSSLAEYAEMTWVFLALSLVVGTTQIDFEN